MTPSRPLQAFVIFLGIAGFAALFGSLLWETWHASGELSPAGIHLYLTPVLAGALGLLLALALGVDPKTLGRRGLGRLTSIGDLLLLGAVVYLLAAVVGAFVWWKKTDETPELVTTLVLTVAGYAVATMTALGRNHARGDGGTPDD